MHWPSQVFLDSKLKEKLSRQPADIRNGLYRAFALIAAHPSIGQLVDPSGTKPDKVVTHNLYRDGRVWAHIYFFVADNGDVHITNYSCSGMM